MLGIPFKGAKISRFYAELAQLLTGALRVS
jgi:hypothetical protein